MKKYIDCKITVWKRVYLKESVDLVEIAHKIEAEGLDTVFDQEEDLNIIDQEILFGTEEIMPIADNDYYSTVEVFEDDGITATMIWSNERNIDL